MPLIDRLEKLETEVAYLYKLLGVDPDKVKKLAAARGLLDEDSEDSEDEPEDEYDAIFVILSQSDGSGEEPKVYQSGGGKSRTRWTKVLLNAKRYDDRKKAEVAAKRLKRPDLGYDPPAVVTYNLAAEIIDNYDS